MSEVIELDAPVRHWGCPACPVTLSKPGTVDEQEYHNCAGTAGLTIPLVEVHEPGAPADARHVPQLGTEGTPGISFTIGREEPIDYDYH